MEKLHFTCQSPANLVRLLIMIQFENHYSARDIAVFHARFDNESDDIFQTFMETLFPDGTTIGEDEINMLVQHTYDFLQKDEAAANEYIEYDKRHTYSYVYSKYDKTIHYADMGSHFHIVMRICADFFKNFDADDITSQKIETFIRNNIEIKSDFTSIDTVCGQANIALIMGEILFAKQYDL